MKSSWNQLFYVVRMVLATAPLAICGSFSLADESEKESAEPQVLKGEVSKVTDGDSVIVKTEDGKEEQVQLEGIDAPEFKQAAGDKAADYLKEKVLKKPVEVRWKARDNYKRILGTIFHEDKDVNLEMLTKGWAWHYERYNKDEKYAAAQKQAKEAKIGLWEEENPTAPWDFRRSNRGGAKEETAGSEKAKEEKKEEAAKE